MRNLFILIFSLAFFLSPQLIVYAEETGIPGGDAFLEGVRLQQLKQWSASLDQFRAAADVYSVVADYALYRIAQISLFEDNDLAVSSLETLIKKYPSSPVRHNALVDLGTLYFKLDRFDRALSFLEAALTGAEWSGETASLKLMLAKTYLGLNDLPQSESICWQLIYNSPSTKEALEAVQLLESMDSPQKKMAVVNVYLRNKKGAAALGVLGELLQNAEIDSLRPELLFLRAQALALDGKEKAAADVYQKLAVDYPKNSVVPAALNSLAEYQKSQGLFEQALATYEDLVKRFPSHTLAPQALRMRAKIFENQQDEREYREYEEILAKYPRSPAATFAAMNWGTDLYRKNDFDGALNIFERLLNIAQSTDSNADALLWIAKSSLAGGKSDAAKTTLQKLVEKYEDSYQAFRARALLRSIADGGKKPSQPYSAKWESLFAVDETAAASGGMVDARGAAETIWQYLSDVDERSLQRLHFLLSNQLPEAKLELDHLSRNVEKNEAHYALAWALFQAQAYYDSIRMASSLSAPVADSAAPGNVRYLLYPAAYPDLLKVSAFKYEVDPLLALAVMREESHFHETSVSASDACGLMQILPTTGKWLAQDKLGSPSFSRSDLFEPAVNIELGNYYLRYLLNKFENNPMLTVAAYNWGETNLRRWMDKAPKDDFDLFVESIPADETRRYVKKVFRSYAIYRSLYPSNWFNS
jgi:soluble lytic murein transglycosylase